MTRRKVILVIVEGPSDETALSVLHKLYDEQRVHIEITHGDITTRCGVGPQNVVKKVNEYVKKAMDYGGFRRTDFLRIIHITDTDGVYVADDKVFLDPGRDKVRYEPDGIYTKSPSDIARRNECKRRNLLVLRSCGTIQTIPYRIYYMSCNLDHVLFDSRNLSDDEKENLSYAFAEQYRSDTDGFVRFICESEFSVNGDYRESWKYIEENGNSLQRHTNFSICLRGDM